MAPTLEPIFNIDLPAPAPPRFSLLKQAEELGTLGEADSPWWEMGGTVWAYSLSNAVAWTGDPDDGSDPVAKPDPNADRIWTVPAFEVVATFECAMRGIDSQAEFMQRAQAAFAAYEPLAVERQFWLGGDDGDADVAMPHLDGDGVVDGDTLTTLNGGTAVKGMLGMALLEQAIAESDTYGVIHIRPGLATFLGNQFLKVSGQSIQTAIMGTSVVAGNGYPGTGRDALAITAQNEWAFATGPVWIRRGEVRSLEAATYDENNWRVTLERSYQVAFDPQVHVAVKIDKAL